MATVQVEYFRLYQKDLGPDSARIAAAINSFDPDPSWSPVR
jgi:hypothetical protein